MQYKKLSLLLKACCGVLLSCSIALIMLTMSSYSGGSTVSLAALEAVYYKGSGSAALLVGSDPRALSSVLPLLRADDGQVLSIATADLSAEEYQRALRQLSTMSGLPSNELLVVAFGDAADQAIRWYFSSSTPLKSLILISPIADPASLIEGGIYSCSIAPAAQILVIDSATMPTDQINRSTELYNLLSGDSIQSNGNPFKASKGNVSMLLSPGSVLYDSPISISLLDQLSQWLGAKLNVYATLPLTLTLKPLLWLILSAALAGFLYSLLVISETRYDPEVYQIVSACVPHPWRFSLSRVLVAILSLPVAALLFVLMSLFRLPVGGFGRSFISYTAACGTVMLTLYHYGWMPGVKGSPTDSKVTVSSAKLLEIAAITAAVALSLYALGYSGFYTIGLSPARGLLFLGLWLLLGVSMRSVSYDMTLIQEIRHESRGLNTMLLLPYLPLLGLAALAVPMGELSMAIAMLKCTFVLICAILLNRITDMLTGSARLSASVSALILAGFLSFYLYI